MAVGIRSKRAQNFKRRATQNPKLLTRCAYLNFLRFYRHNYPKHNTAHLLREAGRVWYNLTLKDRALFKQKVMLKPTKAQRSFYRRLGARLRRRPRYLFSSGNKRITKRGRVCKKK